jgi:hypothetical protein
VKSTRFIEFPTEIVDSKVRAAQHKVKKEKQISSKLKIKIFTNTERFRVIVFKVLFQKRNKMAWRSSADTNEGLVAQLQGEIS